MQLCVNSVQNWISENVFKFSTSKTVCMHFCMQNGFFPKPNILLDKYPSKVVKEAKFPSLIFDPKLTFKNHRQIGELIVQFSSSSPPPLPFLSSL